MLQLFGRPAYLDRVMSFWAELFVYGQLGVFRQSRRMPSGTDLRAPFSVRPRLTLFGNFFSGDIESHSTCTRGRSCAQVSWPLAVSFAFVCNYLTAIPSPARHWRNHRRRFSTVFAPFFIEVVPFLVEKVGCLMVDCYPAFRLLS